jgi:hypothetical protein
LGCINFVFALFIIRFGRYSSFEETFRKQTTVSNIIMSVVILFKCSIQIIQEACTKTPEQSDTVSQLVGDIVVTWGLCGRETSLTILRRIKQKLYLCHVSVCRYHFSDTRQVVQRVSGGYQEQRRRTISDLLQRR